MPCYLDNSATTAVYPAAADKARQMMTECYGNPSSLHTLGIRAEQELTAARCAVASLLGLSDSHADLSTITFTSGGTESNNLAVFGAAEAKKRLGNHIVTTAVEHPSVLEACRELERQGFALTCIVPDQNGDISVQAIADACRADTILVSVMLVNNELGAVFPLEQAAAVIRKRSPKALIHCDAVQAAGKLPLKALARAVDLISISGHKLHAPKGVGALYVRRGVRIAPRVFGGGQERALRSGTEAVPAIAAFGTAVRALPSQKAQQSLFQSLYKQLTDGLSSIDGTVLHQPRSHVDYICNVSVRGFKSETLVHFLAQEGVFVSSGSACAKGHESHVLKALGLPKEETDSSLRISLCADNTPNDIAAFLTALRKAIDSLANTRLSKQKGGNSQ